MSNYIEYQLPISRDLLSIMDSVRNIIDNHPCGRRGALQRNYSFLCF